MFKASSQSELAACYCLGCHHTSGTKCKWQAHMCFSCGQPTVACGIRIDNIQYAIGSNAYESISIYCPRNGNEFPATTTLSCLGKQKFGNIPKQPLQTRICVVCCLADAAAIKLSNYLGPKFLKRRGHEQFVFPTSARHDNHVLPPTDVEVERRWLQNETGLPSASSQFRSGLSE